MTYECVLLLLDSSGCCAFHADVRITACLDRSSCSVNITTRQLLPVRAAYWWSGGFWLITVAVKCWSGNHITACFDHPVPHGTSYWTSFTTGELLYAIKSNFKNLAPWWRATSHQFCVRLMLQPTLKAPYAELGKQNRKKGFWDYRPIRILPGCSTSILGGDTFWKMADFATFELCHGISQVLEVRLGSNVNRQTCGRYYLGCCYINKQNCSEPHKCIISCHSKRAKTENFVIVW